jgi:hypothetical protein
MADSDQDSRSPDSGAVVKAIVCIAVLVAGMAWFVTYEWPSGKSIGLGDFLIFWFRELAILGGLLLLLIVWAIQAIRGK